MLALKHTWNEDDTRRTRVILRSIDRWGSKDPQFLHAAGQIMLRGVRENFRQGGRPTWAPLARSTVESRAYRLISRATFRTVGLLRHSEARRRGLSAGDKVVKNKIFRLSRSKRGVLKPSTQAKLETRGAMIMGDRRAKLRDTGKLASSFKVDTTSKGEVFVYTMDRKAMIHQRGGTFSTKRTKTAHPPRKVMRFFYKGRVWRRAHIGPYDFRIPARPFLAWTPKERRSIEELAARRLMSITGARRG